MSASVKTHGKISAALCGRPEELREGYARVVLDASSDMAADDRGLIHGGFTFCLADYAAMLAVNEPTVVLASATTKFLGPVVAGERLEAEATLDRTDGRKRWVKVTVRRGETVVMEGDFMAVVPDRHILDVPKRS
jgi:acyl-coenzyme A thioesterase PaaI-like protein